MLYEVTQKQMHRSESHDQFGTRDHTDEPRLALTSTSQNLTWSVVPINQLSVLVRKASKEGNDFQTLKRYLLCPTADHIGWCTDVFVSLYLVHCVVVLWFGNNLTRHVTKALPTCPSNPEFVRERTSSDFILTPKPGWVLCMLQTPGSAFHK